MHPANFYTYIYYDPSRNNEPIYVGKGKKKRAWVHLSSSKKHPFIQRLQKILLNGGKPVIGVYAGLDEEFALLLEEELISKFGRKDLGKGTLLNLTNGGEGTSGSTALLGKKKSEVAKRNMSKAKKGKPNGRKGIFKHSQDTKDNLSISLTGRTFSSEWLEKQKLRNHSNKTKLAMRTKQTTRWKNIKDNNIPFNTKPFNKIQSPDKVYNSVHEAATDYNRPISAIYRWCAGEVISRPGWSILKE